MLLKGIGAVWAARISNTDNGCASNYESKFPQTVQILDVAARLLAGVGAGWAGPRDFSLTMGVPRTFTSVPPWLA